mmetsp:Transcript_7101/g.14809  ORF Transcript_7101/g.14809 Transcript_7101/m.14809 type:complete len:140 (-) Transcript_7101:786-1205(-)
MCTASSPPKTVVISLHQLTPKSGTEGQLQECLTENIQFVRFGRQTIDSICIKYTRNKTGLMLAIHSGLHASRFTRRFPFDITAKWLPKNYASMDCHEIVVRDATLARSTHSKAGQSTKTESGISILPMESTMNHTVFIE